jgi:hypothetical protein
VLLSSGAGAFFQLMQSSPLLAPRGITLLTKSKEGIFYRSFDTYDSEEQARDFALQLEKTLDETSFLALLVSDDASVKLKTVENKLLELGFPELSRLKFRAPYIACLGSDGKPVEYPVELLSDIIQLKIILSSAAVSPKLQDARLGSYREIIAKANKQYGNPFHLAKRKNLRSNPNGYIAHAGGAIDGHAYTNSKEALERAVGNGFKYIEIDMLTTSDGNIVGAHDWHSFNKITNSAGARIPPSIDEFKSRTIHNQYTPLTIGDIYDVFKRNPDLILVTDKINDFDLLLKDFPLPDQLIVEVFSIDDYVKALESGVKYPAFSVGNYGMINDTLKFGIKRITTSTKFMSQNYALFTQLHNSGITIMVFGYETDIDSPKPDTLKFFEEYLGRSMSMFYTDYWIPKKGAAQ